MLGYRASLFIMHSWTLFLFCVTFYSCSVFFAFTWSTSATLSALLYTGGVSFFYYASKKKKGSANASGNKCPS